MRLGRRIFTPCRLTMCDEPLARHEPVLEQVAAERAAGASGRGILDDAEAAARACGCRQLSSPVAPGAIGREDEERQLVDACRLARRRVGLRIDGDAVDRGARARARRTGTARRTRPAAAARPRDRRASTPSARAKPARSSISAPNCGFFCVIHAKSSAVAVPLERHGRRARRRARRRIPPARA